MLDRTEWSPELARQRHREFQRKIAEKAAELERSKLPVEVQPEEPAPIKNPFWFHIVSEEGVITVDQIKTVVAEHFNVTKRDLESARRTANFVLPRQIAVYLSRKHTTRTYPELGRLFGGRDHSTQVHAFNKITARMEKDAEFTMKIEAIEAELFA